MTSRFANLTLRSMLALAALYSAAAPGTARMLVVDPGQKVEF